MKNIIPITELKEIIETNWKIQVKKIAPAPRELVAETFFVTSDKKEYFVKVIDAKSRYTNNVLSSLPVIKEIREQKVKNIPTSIETNKGSLAYKNEQVLVMIFQKLEGNSTFDYNRGKYLELLNKIHSLSVKNFTSPVKKEAFEFEFEIELMKNLKLLASREDIREVIETNKNHINDIFKIRPLALNIFK